MMYIAISGVQSNENIRDAVINVTQAKGLKLDAFVRRLCEVAGPRTLATQIIGTPTKDISQEKLQELLHKHLYHNSVLYPIGRDLTVIYEGAIFAPCTDPSYLQLRLF